MLAGSHDATRRHHAPATRDDSRNRSPGGSLAPTRRADVVDDEDDEGEDGPTLLFPRATDVDASGVDALTDRDSTAMWKTRVHDDPEGTTIWRARERAAEAPAREGRALADEGEARLRVVDDDDADPPTDARGAAKDAFGVVATQREPTVSLERSEEKLLEDPQRTAIVESTTRARPLTPATVFDAEVRAELERAEFLDERGLAHLEEGHDDKAWRLHQAALNLRERCLPPSHPLIAVSCNRLAAVSVRRGELAEATRWLERAESFDLDLDLESEPRLDATATQGPRVHAMTLHNLAAVAHAQGVYARALELYTRALTIKQRIYLADRAAEQAAERRGQVAEPDRAGVTSDDPRHPSVALTLFNLGNLYRSMDVFAEAITCYARALAILEALSGATGSPALARVLSCMGRTYLLMSERQRASVALERALSMTRASGSPRARAATRFALAQAIAPEEPRRARAEALEVLDELAACGRSRAVERATRQVQRWLFEHARA